jgi:hypothetical protein
MIGFPDVQQKCQEKIAKVTPALTASIYNDLQHESMRTM